jgi:lysophospholipase
MKKILKALLLIAVVVIVYANLYNVIFSYDSSCEKLKPIVGNNAFDSLFIRENNYEASMSNIVEPFLANHLRSGYFSNGGHSICYNTYLLDSPLANVIISHGFSERKEKFRETVYYFLKMGYQVFVLDHYSHGGSSRLSADSSMLHVDNYHVFTDDLNQFITSVVQPQRKNVKTILYGHSMGGAIAARLVEEHPDVVDGVVLSAPLMKIGTPGAPPEWLAYPIAKLMVLTGNGATYALGQSTYQPIRDSAFAPTNPATFCVPRGKYWHYYRLKLTQHPSSGSSWQMAATLLDMTHDVINKENVRKIKMPILFFQATKDGYTDPKGHYTFINNATNIQAFFVQDAGHELYLESDRVMIPYFTTIHQFITNIKAKQA